MAGVQALLPGHGLDGVLQQEDLVRALHALGIVEIYLVLAVGPLVVAGLGIQVVQTDGNELVVV